MQTNYTIKTLDLIDCFVNFESNTTARSRVKHKQKLAVERKMLELLVTANHIGASVPE